MLLSVAMMLVTKTDHKIILFMLGCGGSAGEKNNFRDGNTKCSDEVYNKVTVTRQQNKHLLE